MYVCIYIYTHGERGHEAAVLECMCVYVCRLSWCTHTHCSAHTHTHTHTHTSGNRANAAIHTSQVPVRLRPRVRRLRRALQHVGARRVYASRPPRRLAQQHCSGAGGGGQHTKPLARKRGSRYYVGVALTLCTQRVHNATIAARRSTPVHKGYTKVSSFASVCGLQGPDRHSVQEP
jgi:hypothetical protein